MTEIQAGEEDLRIFVNKIAEERKLQNVDIMITPVSSGGANYTSKLFKIKVGSKNSEPLHMFAKVAAIQEDLRQKAGMEYFYDRERLFYSFLMKTYRQIEDSHNVLEKDRLRVPEYYGAESTHGREILVLEDLTSRGFVPANRFESVDWSYAASAITELAKFHSLSLAYKHQDPSGFDTFVGQFRQGLFEKNDMSEKLIEGTMSSALTAVREENEDKLKRFFMNIDFVTCINNTYKPLSCKVVLHSDFRPNNMVHKVLNDETTVVIPLDYQTFQAGCPVIDLYYFIFTATDGSFRKKQLKKLIDHYYEELGVALQRLGLNIEQEYPRKCFDFELKEKLPFGLLMSIIALPLLTVPENQAPEIGAEMMDFSSKPTGELYAKRINEVIDEYIVWGVL